MAEHRLGIKITDAVGVRHQIEMYSYTIGRLDGQHRIHRLKQKAGAIGYRTAVANGTLVGAVMQELVKEIAIGRVQLHAVKAAALSIFCRLPVIIYDPGYFVGFQRTRSNIVFFADG